jgi:hypothetical protein
MSATMPPPCRTYPGIEPASENGDRRALPVHALRDPVAARDFHLPVQHLAA